jgi:stage II sporulation protein M
LEDFRSDTQNVSYPRWLTLLAGKGREEYLLSLKSPFLLCLAMFMVSFAFGFIFSNRIPGDLEDFFGELPSLEEVGPLFLMLFLLINNALKAFLWMSLGIFFGIAPLFFIALNAFILGLVAHSVSQTLGPFFVFIAIAPHGVIEFPTTMLSAAVGVKFGYSLINRIRGQGSLIMELKKGLNLFLRRILPLLLLAATVESFVTPLLIYFFFY